MAGNAAGQGAAMPMAVGDHTYPFEFRFPEGCPPSYTTNFGHVKYFLKAQVVGQGMLKSKGERVRGRGA